MESRHHTRIDRRRFLVSLGALAGGIWLGACHAEGGEAPPSSTTTSPSVSTTSTPSSTTAPSCDRGLATIAAERGLLFGASIAHQAFDDPAILDLYRTHAGVLTTDVAFKFDWLRLGPDEWDWSLVDQIMAFAAEIGVPVRPHVLVWNENLPDWVRSLPPEDRIGVFDEHIETVMTRPYVAPIHSWDVVNEPFWPGHGEPGGWRVGPWYEAMGPEYVERAFRRAAAADPDAILVLNEAQTERNDELGLDIRAGLLDLVRGLLDAGVPLHAVGLQGHLYQDPEVPPEVYDVAAFAEFVAELAASGVEVYVTELDVNDELLVRDGVPVDERDGWVAARYEEFLDAVLAIPAVTTVITWQLSDRFSWLREFEPQVRPLPFDDELRSKLACSAIARAFARAPRR